MKNERKAREKEEKRQKIIQRAEEKLARWNRMLAGDYTALVELMVERGMATKEDFPDVFLPSNARA